MKTRLQRPPPSSASKAFSLLEIMVAVSLLTVIMLGLLAMFHQTQKAFRSSMTQTDVLETGRALQDMFAREIAQIAACHSTTSDKIFLNVLANPALYAPWFQNLPGSTAVRTNIRERFYFLTKVNQQWKAVDYQIVFDTPNALVGSLYRWESDYPIARVPRSDSNWFFRIPQITANLTPGHHRVTDGIVHFRIRAYDTNGLVYPIQTRPNIIVAPDPRSGERIYRFLSNALPASLEVEFAMLETPALEQLRSLLSNPVAANRFLSNQVGRVHLFRQRIQLGNSASVVPP